MARIREIENNYFERYTECIMSSYDRIHKTDMDSIENEDLREVKFYFTYILIYIYIYIYIYIFFFFFFFFFFNNFFSLFSSLLYSFILI